MGYQRNVKFFRKNFYRWVKAPQMMIKSNHMSRIIHELFLLAKLRIRETTQFQQDIWKFKSSQLRNHDIIVSWSLA